MDPTKPIEVTEQVPVAVPVPSVPRPELFVVQGWRESHKSWYDTTTLTPYAAQSEARDWDVAHIFRIPSEEEMGAKAAPAPTGKPRYTVDIGSTPIGDTGDYSEYAGIVEGHGTPKRRWFLHMEISSKEDQYKRDCQTLRAICELMNANHAAIASATGGAG